MIDSDAIINELAEIEHMQQDSRLSADARFALMGAGQALRNVLARDTREIVERFTPDLTDKLPDRTTETFDQAFGRMRGAAMRRAAKRRKHKSRR
jgi:hypothetical protein